jgi:hypothetical protein
MKNQGWDFTSRDQELWEIEVWSIKSQVYIMYRYAQVKFELGWWILSYPSWNKKKYYIFSFFSLTFEGMYV